MLYTREITERLTDNILLNTCNISGYTGSQRVVDVMLTCQTERFLFHVERLWLLNLILSLLDITDGSFLLQFREGELDSLDIVFLQLLFDDGVIVPIDEGILRSLVLDDTHLCVNIVLHLEIISVQMVGCDIQQDGNVGTEVVHIIQLEGTQLDDIVFVGIFSNL